jgi:hypothetical protein
MPHRAFLLVLLSVLGALWFLGLRRAGRLFTVEIDSDRARLVHGRLPHKLYGDIEDIARRAQGRRGTARCVVSDGVPRLSFRGSLSSGTEQQLRNVVAGYTAAQIRAGKRQ